eukprot:TRINITY_DN10692_c0_g3_i1.p1 TRINITY_DN10692_c0_g3~~TRINITY_DN10692_c0_g3_i1.p1  ORF type:complete len:321 (+),score=39.05 TRINITY_DN10692_c0_g3_i1:121-1083(+)
MMALHYPVHLWWDFQDAFNRIVIVTWRQLPVINNLLLPISNDDDFGLDSVPANFQGFGTFFTVAMCILAFIWLFFHVLFNTIWPRYASIEPKHKQWYVIANFSKSLFLGGQCLSLAWWYYSYLHHACAFNPLLKAAKMAEFQPCTYDAYPLQESWTKTVSSTYVITDALALIMVPKLPLSTVIHHVSTALFVLLVFSIPLQDYQVGQKLMLYGFWSTIAFPVNAFLALRVLYPTSWALKPFARVSAAIYAVCCFFNWLLHVTWLIDGTLLTRDWTLQSGLINGVYLLLTSSLVNDDLVLLTWLFNFDPTRSHKAKKKKVS